MIVLISNRNRVLIEITFKRGFTLNIYGMGSCIHHDLLDNFFSQQRIFHNGAITHPTYLEYCNTLNSVVLSHTSISEISNTCENELIQYRTLLCQEI